MQQQLGHYQIKDLLGEGSFASVYRAFDQKFERDVALKILKPVWLSDSQAVERFKREAKTMARLRHPHIVDVFDVGEGEGKIYLAQLLVEGETLTARLERGPLAWPEMLPVLQALTAALDYAHEQGVVHRDIKPSNILLDQQRRAYLGDFGLVRAAEGSVALSTVSGGMIGTPAYMAPEQWEGKEVSAATDVYALGCVVVEMLSGKLLFDGSTPAVVMKQHLIEGPQFPDQWPEDVPEGVNQVLQRGLAEDPVERISSAGELSAALIGLTTSPQPDTPIEIEPDGEIPTKPRLTPAVEAAPLWLVVTAVPDTPGTGGTGTPDTPEGTGGTGGQSYQLKLGSQTVGRSPKCDIQIDDFQASREHAVLEFDGQRCLVYDKGSANGTFVNKKWVGPEGHSFSPGDQMMIGDTTFVLSAVAPPGRSADDCRGPPVSSPPLGPPPSTPVSPPKTQRRSSGVTATVVGCGLVLLIIVVGVVAGFMIWGGGATPTPVVVKEVAVEKELTVEKETIVEVEEEVTKEVEKTVESGGVGDTVSAPVRLDTVIGSSAPSLDPALAVDTASVFLVRQMFMRLITIDENGEYQPSLATSWSVSDDAQVWTFDLRDDVRWVRRDAETGKFEDMGPVTAEDVAFGVTRTLDSKTGSDYAYFLYLIKGAEAFNTAEHGSDDWYDALANLGVSALDDHTVVFKLKEPAAYFPAIVAWWIYPQPEGVIEEYSFGWTEPGIIVTNGPYTLQQWTDDGEMWFEKNPLWVDAGNVQIELFGGPATQDSDTALALYEHNEIDMLAPPGWSLPTSELERIKADPDLSTELKVAPQPCNFYYGFVHTKPPVDDPRVRKALAAVIDRKSIIEDILNGGPLLAHSFVPPGIIGSVADDPTVGSFMLGDYTNQVALAQQLMAEAGYPDGHGLDIVLGYNTSPTHDQMAQAVQTMWQKAFPTAQIRLESQEWIDYLNTLSSDAPDADKPHIYRLGWCADYPDSYDMLGLFTSGSRVNYAKFSNVEFDKLVGLAAIELDPTQRKALYRKAESVLIDEETAIAPIYHYTSLRLYKPWLQVVPNLFGDDSMADWAIDWESKKAVRGE